MVVMRKPYKKAIILGAGGFVGINLSHILATKGFDLVCFDRSASPHWPISAKHIIGDFYSMPVELLGSLDQAVVFHLISSCRPSANTTNAAEEVGNDLVTTIRYLEECKYRELRWVFVSSGGTVYGHSDSNQLDETMPTNPICSYGVVKLAIEQYFSLYRKLHNIDYVVARMGNPFGPWQQPLTGQGLVAALIYKALNGDQIDVWGDGENVRDYIYISDAVDGLLAAACSGKSGEIYNIGTGIGKSINELIQIIRDTLKIQVKTRYTEARSVDVKKNILNAKKLFLDTGWRPKISIQLGANLTTDWLKDNFNG